MLKFIQKLFDTGGARIGGGTNYLDISNAGALTDEGTQSHSLNDVTIATLATTTVSRVAAITKAGGTSNYLAISTAGALSDEGTQSHSLNDVTITTLTNSTLGAAKTRSILFHPYMLKASGSAALSTGDTSWFANVLTTSCPASTTNSYLYGQCVLPDDISTATAMAISAYTMKTTTGASVTSYTASASYLGTGEVVAPAGASATCAVLWTNASVANTIQTVAIGNFATGFSAGDLVKFKLGWDTSSGSQTATNDTVWMVRLDYSSLKAY